MRVVFVPSTLALLPEYASIDDPIADLRKAVVEAVDWLVEDGPAAFGKATPASFRIGEHLLGTRITSSTDERLLIVANGSAMRTEKAPGHFDERAAAFDEMIGAALREGDPAALGRIDESLAAELWAPDAGLFRSVAHRVGSVESAVVDYDDAPYGVQYWVVRWQCAS